MIRMRLCLATVLLVLLLNSSVRVGGSRARFSHRDQCEALVKRWAEKELWAMEATNAKGTEEEKLRMQDLLFFLHVPRTGGRNYNQCFLKSLFKGKDVCPRSYDKLRIADPSKPNCTFLSTHDDYSILTKLPKAKTSTITNLRDPIGRVLSSYEFSVEVAARFLKRTRAITAARIPVGPKVQSMNTLDIWPWKYLVPLMQRDLFQRRDSRASGAFSGIRRHPPNIYDAPAYVMPLKEYIEHPMVHELVHNGETFQVAGLTNNSYLGEANEIRSCAIQYEELGEHVLRVAKRRLDGMIYVGLTERHKDSAQLFAHLVGRQVASRNYDVFPAGNATDTAHAYPVYNTDETPSNASNASNEIEPYEEYLRKMVTAYEQCSNVLRESQVHRRLSSFEALPYFNFTKESRGTIPQDVMARIMQLNSLDYELYQYGKKLFKMKMDFVAKQSEELSKLLLVKKTTPTPTTSTTTTTDDMKPVEGDESFYTAYITIVTLVIVLALCYSIIKRDIRARAGRAARKQHS